VHSEFFWGKTSKADEGGFGESFPPHATKAKKHKTTAIGFIRLSFYDLKNTVYSFSINLKDIHARGQACKINFNFIAELVMVLIANQLTGIGKNFGI
jgi:hypothetical protein